MEVDAATSGSAGGGWDGDVDGTVEGFQQPPEHGGGAVTQHRSFSAGEHRGHEAAVEAETAVANGVDASVNAVESPPSGSLRHSSPPQAKCFELAQRDNPMLPPSNLIDPSIDRVEFVLHKETKSTGDHCLPRDSAQQGLQTRTKRP